MALSKYHSLVEVIMKSNDPYMILGVAKSGNNDEIDKCYKRTMSKVHPDKNSHPLATKAAQKVNVSRDILLNRSDRNFKFNSEASEFFTNIKEESSKLLRNLRYMMYIVPFLMLIWIMHIVNYLLANEWSLTRSSIHSFERTTLIYRIRYFTLSESSPRPPEFHILQQYLTSVGQSCKKHLDDQGWFATIFYFPEQDLCTEGKISLIYAIILVVFLRIIYNYFIKRRR